MRLALAVLAGPLLLAAGAPSEDRALFSAARAGDAPAVRRLLRDGRSATARDARGRTPLHDAASSGSVEAVQALLAAGAEANARERSGWTPLMDAARAGRLAAAKALLAAGADPDARDRAAGTVLDVAQEAGQDEIVTLLRSHGAQGGGKSKGDRVCVRPWKGEGFCGIVQAIRDRRYEVRVTSLVGCAHGCPPDEECSAGRAVGGDLPDAVIAGASVEVPSWCLTHTGLP